MLAGKNGLHLIAGRIAKVRPLPALARSHVARTSGSQAGDQFLIDTVAVNGSANTVGFIAGIVRRVQSGFLYSYAFWMVIGLAVMLGWFLTLKS